MAVPWVESTSAAAATVTVWGVAHVLASNVSRSPPVMVRSASPPAAKFGNTLTCPVGCVARATVYVADSPSCTDNPSAPTRVTARVSASVSVNVRGAGLTMA